MENWHTTKYSRWRIEQNTLYIEASPEKEDYIRWGVHSTEYYDEDWDLHETSPYGFEEHKEEIHKIVIGPDCNFIGRRRFQDYPNLTTVALPNNIKKISKNAFFRCG